YMEYDASDSHVKNHVELQNFDHNQPGLQPEFGDLVREYPSETAVSGPVRAMVFHSKDGSLEYTFFVDQEGRGWVASVSSATAGVSELGVPSQAMVPADKDIMTPLWEYHQQIPGGMMGETHPELQQYASAWPYLSQHPLIQAFYAGTGMQMPGARGQEPIVQEQAPAVEQDVQVAPVAAGPMSVGPTTMLDLFTPGAEITVVRSNGERQSGWQIQSFDGTYVMAATDGLQRRCDPVEILRHNPQLLHGHDLVVKRSSGELDPGWQVLEIAGDRVLVGRDGMQKSIPLDDLLSANGFLG
ncbi:MAG: hypothetical protein KJO07_06535, partial [Deltaproteobacteria bacterium]|nr:hypothetical protein [Deltaproteobacteria bacterium]